MRYHDYQETIGKNRICDRGGKNTYTNFAKICIQWTFSGPLLDGLYKHFKGKCSQPPAPSRVESLLETRTRTQGGWRQKCPYPDGWNCPDQIHVGHKRAGHQELQNQTTQKCERGLTSAPFQPENAGGVAFFKVNRKSAEIAVGVGKSGTQTKTRARSRLS